MESESPFCIHRREVWRWHLLQDKKNGEQIFKVKILAKVWQINPMVLGSGHVTTMTKVVGQTGMVG